MRRTQESDRRAVCKLTDVGEFIAELARDAELVERRIVRLTQEARAAHGGAFHCAASSTGCGWRGRRD